MTTEECKADRVTDLIQVIDAIKADDPTLLPRVGPSPNKLEFPDLLLPSSPSPQPSRPRLSEQTNKRNRNVSQLLALPLGGVHSQSRLVLPWRGGAPESRCVA